MIVFPSCSKLVSGDLATILLVLTNSLSGVDESLSLGKLKLKKVVDQREFSVM